MGRIQRLFTSPNLDVKGTSLFPGWHQISSLLSRRWRRESNSKKIIVRIYISTKHFSLILCWKTARPPPLPPSLWLPRKFYWRQTPGKKENFSPKSFNVVKQGLLMAQGISSHTLLASQCCTASPTSSNSGPGARKFIPCPFEQGKWEM